MTLRPATMVNTENIGARIDQDCTLFNPRYVVVYIGTNDTVTATFETYIATIERKIRLAGAIPVFCTLCPRDDLPAFAATVNPWLIAQGYRIVHLDRALTVNGDGVTRNTALFTEGDILHPNNDGALAMYARFRLDLPELFD